MRVLWATSAVVSIEAGVVEGAGLLLAVDPILKVGRTAVDVAGQMLVPTAVPEPEAILAPFHFAHDVEA